MVPIHPLLNRQNEVKKKLLRGIPQFGLFLVSGSPVIAEALATLPIDWLVVDMEASPISFSQVADIFRALNGAKALPMVRIPELGRHAVEHSLDLGAYGVMTPKIDNPQAAQRFAQYSYFPPIGARGVNPIRVSGYFDGVAQYLSTGNESTLAIAQIESKEAIERIDSIAATPGVDLLFIGMGDLSLSFGQGGTVTGDKMDSARAKVIEACRMTGKIPGIFAYTTELAEQYLKEGFLFIAFGNDLKAIKEHTRVSLESLRPET